MQYNEVAENGGTGGGLAESALVIKEEHSTLAAIVMDTPEGGPNELLLKDSIFLRYLPLPLIKKAHYAASNSLRDFIDIF